MKRLLNIVFSLLLAVIILISTSGFMVYLHHCNHRNTIYTSLFFSHHHRVQPPCKISDSNCCHQHENDNHQFPPECETSCCKDIAIMLKLTPDSEPAQKNFTKFIKVIVTDCINKPVTIPDLAETSYTRHPVFPPGKPPKTGKEKVILHHQLKEDPSC